MKKIIVVVGAVAALATFAAKPDVEALRKAVAEDLAQPVRPGGVNGQAFWNKNAVWFLYPPSFDFPAVKGANAYRFRVFDAKGKVHDFSASSPKESLARIWKDLPTGKTDVWCEGYCGWAGHIIGRSFRSFYKMAPFDPEAYPKAPRSYAEAAKLGYDYLLNMPALKSFAETGKPDPSYKLNCYPSKIHSAVIRAMLTCAKSNPAQRDAALKLARAAADYLLAAAQPEGAPLAGFTPTYEGKNFTAAQYAGQTMLEYPCSAGSAFLGLYKATGEEKYLAGATRIAATYLRLQGADGTWYLKLWIKDGKCVNPNRLHPLGVIAFMDQMFAVTGKAEYRACADRAFGFIEAGPLKDWNWEGQFEDVEPTEKYVNLTKHPACATAIRLITRWPNDPKRLAQARELLRYAEDQFVCWRRPFKEDDKMNLLAGAWEDWITEPGVVEQYYYRENIDASLAKMVKTFLALYRASGNALDLAKARAIGDALVRAQQPSGRIPTCMTTSALSPTTKHVDWLNCMIADFEALDELAQVTKAECSSDEAKVDFTKKAGVVRPALYSSGWSPRVYPRHLKNDDAAIRALGMTYTRTHDWALVNSGQRLVDTCRIFPLMHLDAKDPKNYVFGPTDEALRLARNVGLKICYRLGESIEHTEGVHFNVLVPEDYDKYAEVMAGIVRHYNRGWANGYHWNIEYWNFWEEPDGINNLWCLPGKEGQDKDAMRRRFIRLFVTVLKRLKSEFPEIKVGGPALCWCNLAYFRELIEACLKEGLKPDFLSWDMYSCDPDMAINDAHALRKLCDSLGCTKTEIVLAEWHYLVTWTGVHGQNATPEQVRAALNGPTGINQIDSACFALTLLSKFQFSSLDQAYYYGCMPTGHWGYLNEDNSFNKPYRALCAFGSLIAGHKQLYAADSLQKSVTVFAVGSDKADDKALLVTDYRGTSRSLSVAVAGIAPGARVSVRRLDHEHSDWVEQPARWQDGRLTLEKDTPGSAAFLVTFGK